MGYIGKKKIDCEQKFKIGGKYFADILASIKINLKKKQEGKKRDGEQKRSKEKK